MEDFGSVFENINGFDGLGLGASDELFVGEIESELGKVGVSPQKRPQVARAIAKITKKAQSRLPVAQSRAALNRTMSDDDAFLLSKFNELDPATQESIRRDTVRRVRVTPFKRIALADNQGGMIEIWNATNQQIYGISNIDKNFLPNAWNFVLNSIKLSYGVFIRGNQTIANNGLEPALGSCQFFNTQIVPPFVPPNTSFIPAALLNSHFVFSVNDEPVVEVPTNELFILSPQANLNYTGGYTDYYSLRGQRYLLKERNYFKAEIKFGDNQVLPPPVQPNWLPAPAPGFLTHALEIKLGGISTRPGKNS